MRTSLLVLCLFIVVTVISAAKRNGRETGTALHLTDLHLDLRYQVSKLIINFILGLIAILWPFQLENQV